MKQIFFVLTLLSSISLFAQTFNKFDSNGKRDGLWKKNFENTPVLRYEGTFSHGKEVGIFKFYKNIKGKAVLTATREFNADNNDAEVTFYASNGNVISKGNMRNKTYIGTWKYYHSDGKTVMTLENYNIKGLLEGERFIYYPNGQVAEKANYINGLLEGVTTNYDEDGTVIKIQNYKQGNLNGLFQFFDKSGVILVEGNYKNDQKHGIWKYYEDGKVSSEKDFTPKSKNPYKKGN
ncbi:toxin-antitoxin system YwqK family antitoxin [Bizionia sp. KMM 8389]